MEDISDWLSKLKFSTKAIVVEGKKDKLALKKVGIPEERIFALNDAVFAVAESVSEKYDEVIILTDLDEEGRKLFSNLKRNFSRLGVKVDTKFREFLFRNTKLSHIEGLDTYLRNANTK